MAGNVFKTYSVTSGVHFMNNSFTNDSYDTFLATN